MSKVDRAHYVLDKRDSYVDSPQSVIILHSSTRMDSDLSLCA
jgi:hypothetical protein